MNSATSMVSIEDLGKCICSQITVREGVWGLVARGWPATRCENCTTVLLPRNFGIAVGDNGAERFSWLDQDGKFTSVRPEAGFKLGNLHVYASVMELPSRGRIENAYYHAHNMVLDFRLRWRTWRKSLRGKIQKISSTKQP